MPAESRWGQQAQDDAAAGINTQHGGTQGTSHYNTTVSDGPSMPRPRYPRNRAPANPWTNPGAGNVRKTLRSADPFSGGGGGVWGGYRPITAQPAWGGKKVTPAGQPGPTKYQVEYGFDGRPVKEMYDAGQIPAGKAGPAADTAPVDWAALGNPMISTAMPMNDQAMQDMMYRPPAGYQEPGFLSSSATAGRGK